jgi:predicted esterase
MHLMVFANTSRANPRVSADLPRGSDSPVIHNGCAIVRPVARQSFGTATLGIVSSSLRLSRRAAAVGASIASLSRANEEFIDRMWQGRRGLLVPSTAPSKNLLVLLHGLGETADPQAGAYAFWERYGLRSALARLKAPPIKATTKLGYYTEPALRSINERLMRAPFEQPAIFCPHMPAMKTSAQIAAYGDWLIDKALPEVKRELVQAGHTINKVALAGCSLGAFVALEIFQSHPTTFVTLGGVQSAISSAAAERYASTLATAGTKGPQLYFSTSSADPYREPTRTLIKGLSRKEVSTTLFEAPGPHDQVWLREVGTPELLVAMAERFR